MRKPSQMLTIADTLFTLFCLITVVVWYMHIPYRIEITSVLGLLALGTLFYSKKGLDAQSEFLKFHTKILENEKYFKSGFDYAATSLALVSLDGHFIKVNHALCQLLDYSENELLKTSLRRIIPKKNFRKTIESTAAMRAGEAQFYQANGVLLTKAREMINVLTMCSFVPDKLHKPLYYVVQFQTEKATAAVDNDLKFLNTDTLTSLYNRNYLDAYMNKIICTPEAERGSNIFALLILDIDALRNINNSIGHEAGNAAIQAVAERLKNLVRSVDIVARIGGDEFAIVIQNAKNIEIIAQITQKMLSAILKVVKYNGRDIYLTASAGVSLYPNDGKDVETLLTKADGALFKAKQLEGNNYQFCSSNVTELAQEKSKQQSALNQAIVKNELHLYYQPCINMQDESIACVEALIRWQSSEYGLVLPDTIIPLAEESGLILTLSEWVLRTACKQVKTWQRTNPSLKLAINLSAYQFKNANFMNNIMRALKEVEFPPQNLILEITEGLILHDHENTTSILKKVREEGISVVVDNFGTGFSSFSYMNSYGVSKIKIDRSFITNMTKSANEFALVGAMISMANKLGIKAVAEGVETKEQYDLLLKENCDEIQGYYIARPMAVELMESFIASRQKVKNVSN